MSLIPILDCINQCTKFISESLFQVLISDANGESAMITNGKDKHPKASSSKKIRANTPSESHVEMDSRLLTALLTVSKHTFFHSFVVVFIMFENTVT